VLLELLLSRFVLNVGMKLFIGLVGLTLWGSTMSAYGGFGPRNLRMSILPQSLYPVISFTIVLNHRMQVLK
jgi:hypothetical protein